MKSASNKVKTNKSEMEELALRIAEFTLPESLPTSEVDYPVLGSDDYSASWKGILADSDSRLREVLDYIQSKKEPTVTAPFISTECEFIQERVFPRLLPALEETLTKVRIWNATENPKCFFNGIDHVAQVLWNTNPRYPERDRRHEHIFNMPWVRDVLQKNPRPYYPKSWLWPAEYAATVLQAHWRRYTVQKDEDVQEMRDFWRKLQFEKENPVIASNPLLAKKFASSKELHKRKNSV